MVIKKVFAAALLATVTACNTSTGPLASQSVPIFTSSNATAQGSTVEVRIETGTQLKTLAAKKTITDVHHYHIKLINTTNGVVMAEGDATDLVSFFQKVPNGIYKVNVDALDAAGNSIVQGGAQDSSNTVTVAAPNVTYSDGGPCLKVRLKLLNATGEKVGNKIIVEDGDEWTGTPELQPGGNCPCPTPTPSAPAPSPTPYSCFGQPMTANNIYTVAGSDNWDQEFTDNIPATSGTLSWPLSVAVDADQNLYAVAGSVLGSARVRFTPKSSNTFFGQTMTAYNLYSIVGQTGLGDSGDGGPATAAQFNNQGYVSLDQSGNLYITDAGNNRIRFVPRQSGSYFGQTMTGNYIYSIAGNGTLGQGAFAGDGGPATDSKLNSPSGPVAIDQVGNLYFADMQNRRIRMIPKVSGTYFGQPMTANYIYSVAGNGAAGFSGDGSAATSASLNGPRGVAIDSQGNLIVADQGNRRIRIVAKTSNTYFGQTMAADAIYTIAGTGASGSTGDGGAATSATFTQTTGVAVDQTGNVFVADFGARRVRMIARQATSVFGQSTTIGSIYTVAGDGSSSPVVDGVAATTSPVSPWNVTLDSQGNLFIADNAAWRIRMVPRQGCQ